MGGVPISARFRFKLETSLNRLLLPRCHWVALGGSTHTEALKTNAVHSMIFLLSPAKTLKAVQTAIMKGTQPNEALAPKAQAVLTELQALSRDQLRALLKVSDPIAKYGSRMARCGTCSCLRSGTSASLCWDARAHCLRRMHLAGSIMNDIATGWTRRRSQQRSHSMDRRTRACGRRSWMMLACSICSGTCASSAACMACSGLSTPSSLTGYTYTRSSERVYAPPRSTRFTLKCRLEMGTKFKVGKAANLTEYWRDSIAENLNAELDQMPEEQRFVVNCASQVCHASNLSSCSITTGETQNSNHPLCLPAGVLQSSGY